MRRSRRRNSGCFGCKAVMSPLAPWTPEIVRLKCAIRGSGGVMQAIFQRAYEWRQRPGFAIACEWLRRYVFAIACVVAPIVLGYFTFNYAVHRIIPRTTEGLSFVYEAAKPISQATPAPPQHSAPDTSAAANTETAIAAPDSKIYL